MFFVVSIGGMRLRLQELQSKDKQAQKAKAMYSEDWDNIKEFLHYQGLFFVLKIIWTEFISRHHNNLLVDHFDIEKI